MRLQRLGNCENYVGKREELVFDAFTFEFDLHKVTLNQRYEYFGQRSFDSKVIVRTHIYPHRAGPVSLKRSVIKEVAVPRQQFDGHCPGLA